MVATPIEEVLRNGIRESLKNRFKERRGKLEIMADVLSAARKGARKTEIVYKANLNFNRVERYLLHLEENGLIANTGALYTTTDKGRKFLHDFQQMKNRFAI